MRDQQIIFSDLDGTIIDGQTFEVHPDITELLKQQAPNLQIVLATSRGWDGVMDYKTPLRLRLPQIIEGGAAIIDPITEEILYERNISQSAIDQIIQIAHLSLAQVTFSAKTYSATNLQELRKARQVGRISLLVPKQQLMSVVNKLQRISSINAVYGPTMQADGLALIDIKALEVNKASAIQMWMEMFGRPQSPLYVAGNSEDDLVLFDLEYLYDIFKVTVEDGCDKLKDRSDLIIPSAHDDGFIKFMTALSKKPHQVPTIFSAAK